LKFKSTIRILTLTITALSSWNSCYSQYTSNNGNFNIDENKGCTTLSITITSNKTSCPCDASCPCDVFPDAINNPNNFTQNDLNLNYPTAGIYQLVVQLQNFEKDTIQLEVVENTIPQFELTTCVANQVNVEILDNNFDTYELNYNDGTIITVNNGQLVPTYTYSSSGAKLINVRGVNLNAADNCSSNNSQPVEVLPLLQDANINYLTLQTPTAAQLDYSGQANTTYHLQIAINNDLNFQRYLNNTINPTQNTLLISDTNLDFEQNYYCFRIATYDKCSNSYTGFSNSICSVNLDPITIGNKEMILNWNASNSNLNQFNITKNEVKNYNSVTTHSFTDTNQIICNSLYCYRVVADYSTNGTILSTSLEYCATAISTDIPSPIVDINVSVTEPNIDINWELPLNYSPTNYNLYKSNSSTPISITATNYTDANINTACYQVDYTDACLVNSEISKEVCSIYIEHQIQAGVISLNWNEYDGWDLGIKEYIVIVESTNGNNSYSAGTSNSYQLPTESSNTQLIKVTIQAIPNNSSLNNVNSNSIQIINNTNIQFPNAFSPEGVNSSFNVKGRYIKSVDIKIFTRWGEIIAHITDIDNGWNGNINGKKAPGGTYIYTAEIVDDSGQQHVRSGALLLIRK